ncbi:protein kinase [Streptomyces niveiscabiei]|uniref:protein kinase domain-containing protein n=1 Tax=Streptomyces niveiscabiei TaxID=164115 RepID=UPI0029AF280D|nr:protein kinase [Streptomyces niveiscabiei]MDX3384562.1 protein kinase [Streptomyces niveiscabiei]
MSVTVPKGYRVGAWEVREELASGAFATVYAGRRAADTAVPGGRFDGADRAGGPGGAAGAGGAGGIGGADGTDGSSARALPRDVALKFLPTGTRTPRQLRHLRELADREVELLSRLRTPRLIRLYDVVMVEDPDLPELDGATVLVLERAEGSLDTLPLRDTRTLAQICEGLHQLHHAGWVHGDLKPANVLLMKDGSVRLADFSTAAELEGTHAYAPLFTTPDYTPPELLWPEVSERGTRIRPTADIWAFGILAHVLLTGTHPLPGATPQARTDAALRYTRGTQDLRLSAELPPEWREIIQSCLTPDHTSRLTAKELLRRVESATESTRSPRLPRLRPLRWRRPALAAALAVALLGAGSATYAALRDREPVATAPPTCEKPALYSDAKHGSGYTAGWNGTWDFTIKRGDGGSQVRELQCLLRNLHGIPEVGEVDGDFGPLTHGAVVTFQKRAGLDADGVVGPRTWAALRKGS